MFANSVRNETTRKLAVRVVCCLFTALLVVGNAMAVDDPIEIDPNGFTWVLDLFSKAWNDLAGLFA